MIALTWVLALPRATDMARVRARLEHDGAVLSQSDGLLAGLLGVSEAGVENASHSAIAHASVWANSSRMGQFLWSDTMVTFERDFARPSGRLWSVTSVQLDRSRLVDATHLGIAKTSAAPAGTLPAIVDEHKAGAARSMVGRSTALACRGVDPATWDEGSIDAWTGRPRTFAGSVFSVVSVAAPAPAQ